MRNGWQCHPDGERSCRQRAQGRHVTARVCRVGWLQTKVLDDVAIRPEKIPGEGIGPTRKKLFKGDVWYLLKIKRCWS